MARKTRKYWCRPESAEVYVTSKPVADPYTVILCGMVFTMSEQPQHPQGVNQYVAEVGECDPKTLRAGRKIPWSKLPEKVKRAIRDWAKPG